MILRFARFKDPMYSADVLAEFDADDVIAVEERKVSLLMRGKFWATYVTLKSGVEFSLSGRVAHQIEAAKTKSKVAA
jgi:hypothetical protein